MDRPLYLDLLALLHLIIKVTPVHLVDGTVVHAVLTTGLTAEQVVDGMVDAPVGQHLLVDQDMFTLLAPSYLQDTHRLQRIN